MPLPSSEWAMARANPGTLEVMHMSNKMMDAGVVVVSTAKTNDGSEWKGDVPRTVNGDGCVKACNKASNELLSVDMHHYCSSDEGDAFVTKLIGDTRARNAIQDYVWSLIFGGIDEEEVALAPMCKRRRPLKDLMLERIVGRKRAASHHARVRPHRQGQGQGQIEGKDRGNGGRDRSRTPLGVAASSGAGDKGLWLRRVLWCPEHRRRRLGCRRSERLLRSHLIEQALRLQSRPKAPSQGSGRRRASLGQGGQAGPDDPFEAGREVPPRCSWKALAMSPRVQRRCCGTGRALERSSVG